MLHAVPPHVPCEVPALFAVDAAGAAVPFAATPLQAQAFVDAVLHCRAALHSGGGGGAGAGAGVGAGAAPAGGSAALRARFREELQAAQGELSLLRNALTFSRGSRWVGQHADRDNIFALARVAAPAPPEAHARATRAQCLEARSAALTGAAAYLLGAAARDAAAQAAGGRFGATLLRACAAAGWEVLAGPAAAAAAAASALAHAPHLAHYALSPAHAHLVCCPRGYPRAHFPPSLRSLAPLLILPPPATAAEAAGGAGAPGAPAAGPQVRLQAPLHHAPCRLAVRVTLGASTALAHALPRVPSGLANSSSASGSGSGAGGPLAACATEGERLAVAAVLEDAALFAGVLALELGFAALLAQGAALAQGREGVGALPRAPLLPAAPPQPPQEPAQDRQPKRARRAGAAGSGAAGSEAAAAQQSPGGQPPAAEQRAGQWAVSTLSHNRLTLEGLGRQGGAVAVDFCLLPGSEAAEGVGGEGVGAGPAAAAALRCAEALGEAVRQGPLLEGFLAGLLAGVA